MTIKQKANRARIETVLASHGPTAATLKTTRGHRPHQMVRLLHDAQQCAADMGNRTMMLELAERCEKATGPDYELDDAILLAINGGKRPMRPVEGMSNAQTTYQAFYTASLDAAMALVPDGFAWVLYWDGFAGVERITGDDLPQVDSEPCATTALALCAAALRARAK